MRKDGRPSVCRRHVFLAKHGEVELGQLVVVVVGKLVGMRAHSGSKGVERPPSVRRRLVFLEKHGEIELGQLVLVVVGNLASMCARGGSQGRQVEGGMTRVANRPSSAAAGRRPGQALSF